MMFYAGNRIGRKIYFRPLMLNLVITLVLSILITASGVNADIKNNSSKKGCLTLFQPAYIAGDFSELSRLFGEQPDDQICSYSVVEEIRYLSTLKVIDHARTIFDSGDIENARNLVNGKSASTFRLVSTWQLNELLADIERAQENWREAAIQYQTAFDISQAERNQGSNKNNNKAAKPAVEDLFLLQASEMTHLAASLSGGDIFISRGRVTRESIPTPIQFRSESAELTKESLVALTSIVSFLQKYKMNVIEVVGHTDWRGEEEYNQWLSERRAESVAKAIRAVKGGSEFKLITNGRGETCPRVLSDISRFDRDELAALYRRVEIRWDTTSRLKQCDGSGFRE